MKTPSHILITGASSGIGEALAVHYAATGTRLLITGRNSERLMTAAGRCRDKGAEVDARVVDVADADAMTSLIAECDDARPLDLVIANAGVGLSSSKDRSLHDVAEATFAVNVHGVFNTVHPALQRMKARARDDTPGGQIAIVSSIAAYHGLPGAAPYAASKAAVKSYGEGLRGAYHDRVEINVICPGFVESRMTANNRFPMPFKMTAEKAARIIARGLAKNKAIIAFPFPTAAGMRLIQILPAPMSDALLRRSPKK